MDILVFYFLNTKFRYSEFQSNELALGPKKTLALGPKKTLALDPKKTLALGPKKFKEDIKNEIRKHK